MERMRQILRGTLIHAGDPANQLSSATHEMSASVMAIDERNTVIASAYEEQVQVAHE
eukprot:gene6999-6846_t